MAEQNPDQVDPQAEQEQAGGPDDAADAHGVEAEGSAPQPGKGANSADADRAPGPDAADTTDVDDMAAAALEAAKSAISDLNTEADVAAEGDPADAVDPALVDQMMANLDKQAADGGRTIGKPSPRGGSLEGVDLPSLQGGTNGHAPEGIELLSDVDLQVKIELGRTVMLVEDVLRLNAGSIVELDKLAGDPVDVYVNDRRVARGEVLVLNDAFCVRISEVLAPVKQMSKQ